MTGTRTCPHCSGWLRKPLTIERYLFKCANCSRTWGDNPDYPTHEELFATPIMDSNLAPFQRRLKFEYL